MTNAIDLARPVTPAMADQMIAVGCLAALRYLSNNAAKNLSLGEARMLSAKGISMAVVWEAQGNDYNSFTAAQGRIDAHHALLEASALTIPLGRTVYFCADFDATDAEIDGGITDYMTGVCSVMRTSGYLVGVYGNGAVCKAMLDRGFAAKAWLWGADETNGTLDFLASGRWSIHQRPTAEEFGASVDPDTVQGDFGAFILAPAAAVAATIPVPAAMQQALAVEGLYTGTIDGQWGPLSQAALAAHYRGAAGG